MVLIYQVLTRQCLKKVFLTSNDFIPNDSSLLKEEKIDRVPNDATLNIWAELYCH